MRIQRMLAAALGVAMGFAAIDGVRAETPAGLTGMAAQPALSGAHDGGYVGVLAGYNATSLDAPDLPNLAESGFLAGAYIGYGIVQQGIYWGVEADGVVRDVRTGITDGVTTITASNKWLASGRIRVGLPIGPALLYGTGGLAVQESTLDVDAPMISIGDSQMQWGAVLGAGMEAKLTNTLHVRVEALHYAWRDEKFNLAGTDAKLGQDDTVIRIGIGWKLH
jgi:outer membrane immunogenic protein